MIVWSRGLGKIRLPLDLAAATTSTTPNHLVMEGTIERVCWRYAVRLSPQDLRDFLRLLADPRTARFMAERGGVLGPFVFGLLKILPRLVFKMLVGRTQAAEPAE